MWKQTNKQTYKQKEAPRSQFTDEHKRKIEESIKVVLEECEEMEIEVNKTEIEIAIQESNYLSAPGTKPRLHNSNELLQKGGKVVIEAIYKIVYHIFML